MSATPPPNESQAPPPGEEIHLPNPSIVPLLNAVGLTFALVGLATSLVLTVIGTILFLWTTIRWIRESAREMDELPLDHGAH